MIRAGLLRALAFHEAWGYAPTIIELISSWDQGKNAPLEIPARDQVQAAVSELVHEGVIVSLRGRVIFPDQQALIIEHERREIWFPRKIRRTRSVARWLARLQGVRFVALCNTTALAHARDVADLDFFIVTHAGTLWQTRGLAALPYKLLGQRPRGVEEEERDAVCLSFFVDDAALDLSSLQLAPDDPYLRHWFLSLLPLVDDGVGECLWRMNQFMTQRHPLAARWQVHPELAIGLPLFRVPSLPVFESFAHRVQKRVLPAVITNQANRTTEVVVTDHVLKLHATDNRERFREVYYAICKQHGIDP